MNKRNISIILLALGVIAGTAWWFALKPGQEAEIDQLTTRLETLRRENNLRVQQLSTARNAIPELRSELAELTNEHANYVARIPQNDNLPQLLDSIGYLGDHHAIEYRGIQQRSKEQLLPDIYQISYTLNTYGQFNDQVNFITELQNITRLVIVDSVNLSATGNDPRRPMTNATITFRAFVNGTASGR